MGQLLKVTMFNGKTMGQSHFLITTMGKSTISMTIFNSYVSHYQRVPISQRKTTLWQPAAAMEIKPIQPFEDPNIPWPCNRNRLIGGTYHIEAYCLGLCKGVSRQDMTLHGTVPPF